MLKKLIKYDLKWSFKVVSIFLGLGFAFAVLGKLFSLIENSTVFNIISLICNGTALSLIISGLINCIIRSWVRIITNLYKDESYLTHTLPISRETHYLSKIISFMITVLVSIIILVISVFIMYYSKNTIELIKQSLNLISQTLNSSVTLLIILIVLVLLLEIIFIVFCGNFGIVLGHTYNRKKGSKSFLFGLMAYGIANATSITILMISSIFSKDVKDLLFGGNDKMDYSLLIVMLWGCVILYSIYNVVLYLLTNNIFKKGINVD